MLEGSLLKPAMVVPGVDAADKSDPTEIAQLTVRTLERCVPGAMPGVTFLSGGISEEDASIYLNEINKVPRKTQTRLTFSYSRALQSVTLEASMALLTPRRDSSPSDEVGWSLFRF